MSKRHCPERAFPAQAYQPGRGPHPSTLPDPDWPIETWTGDPNTLEANSTFLWGVDLYNHGYYWEAHEAWEDLWKCAERDTAPRQFLQGLIQCAGSALKASLQEEVGCRRLANKGLAKLESLPSSGRARSFGVDVAGFTRAFREYVLRSPVTGQPPTILLAAEY